MLRLFSERDDLKELIKNIKKKTHNKKYLKLFYYNGIKYLDAKVIIKKLPLFRYFIGIFPKLLLIFGAFRKKCTIF